MIDEELLKEKLEIPDERLDAIADEVIKTWVKKVSGFDIDVEHPDKEKEDEEKYGYKTLFNLNIQLERRCFEPFSVPYKNVLMITDDTTGEQVDYEVETKEDIKEILCQYIDDLFEEPVED